MDHLVRVSRAVSDWVDRLVVAASLPIGLMCIGVLIAGAAARLVEGPGPRLVEYSEIAFVWAVFLGVVLPLRRSRRVRLPWLGARTDRVVRRRIELGASLLVSCLLVVLVVIGLELQERVEDAVFPASGLSKRLLYLPLPVADGVILVHFTAGLIEQVALFARHSRTAAWTPPVNAVRGIQERSAAPPTAATFEADGCPDVPPPVGQGEP